MRKNRELTCLPARQGIENGGFTLVEVVIYVAVLGIMIGFIAFILNQVGAAAAANKSRFRVESEAAFIMAKVDWAMRGASSIELPVAGATSSSVRIRRHSEPAVVDLFFASGTIYMSRSGDSIPLSGDEVAVTDFSAAHEAALLGAPSLLRLQFTVRASSSDPKIRASSTLQTSFSIR